MKKSQQQRWTLRSWAWLLGSSFLGMPVLANAEQMTGYVAPLYQQSFGDQSRSVYRLEFARLTRYISVDFRYGSGDSYKDVGGMLRLFKHYAPWEDQGSGISLGIGAGYMYSAKGIGNTGRKFSDIVVSPFARLVWDTKLGFGIVSDFGMEYTVERQFQSPTQKTTPGTSNLQVAIGFAIGA
jgi:hypothetical protein